MLSNTQIESRKLIIEQIDKLIEKNQIKADKEKAKKKSASVTYKGETFHSDRELQDAFACDFFSSSTYDRLSNKLDKARGNIDENSFTPAELLVMELLAIKNNFVIELSRDSEEKQRKEKKEARAKELADEGYSFREIETILGNEELMRYE